MANLTDVHEAIVAADEKFMTTFNNGDAAGIAALYTENGQFLCPHGDFVTGRQAIQATFQSFMDMGIKAIKLLSRYENTVRHIVGHGRTTIDRRSMRTLENQGISQNSARFSRVTVK